MTMHGGLIADSGGAVLPAALAVEMEGGWAVTSDTVKRADSVNSVPPAAWVASGGESDGSWQDMPRHPRGQVRAAAWLLYLQP